METGETARESRTALVTGAAGFIGSRLAERLHADGWRVRGADNERSGDWTRSETAIERKHVDLGTVTAAELAELCEGVDVVFHLAAEKYNSSRTTPDMVIAVNIAGTRRLLEAAVLSGVEKAVFTSSLYVYGISSREQRHEHEQATPTTVYGMSKVAGELLLEVAAHESGLRWSVARPFFIYGPGQHVEGGYKSVIMSNFERILRGEAPVVLGDGEQALDYVYVDDCVDHLLRLVPGQHDGGTFNIASGQAPTVNELTQTMLRIAGSELDPVHGPADWTSGTVRVGSPDRSRSELGWSAQTSLDEGLSQVWTWLARR